MGVWCAQYGGYERLCIKGIHFRQKKPPIPIQAPEVEWGFEDLRVLEAEVLLMHVGLDL